MSKVEVYGTRSCPYCIRTRRLLDMKKVVYVDIDAPHGSRARVEMMDRSGRLTVPQIFVDGQHIGGCDDLMDLERAGQLDGLLGRK